MKFNKILYVFIGLALGTMITAFASDSEFVNSKEISTLNDVLDCKVLSWMDNCDENNDFYKNNPTAIAKLQDKDGLEFYFVPEIT